MNIIRLLIMNSIKHETFELKLNHTIFSSHKQFKVHVRRSNDLV